jgi:hypothetical protein
MLLLLFGTLLRRRIVMLPRFIPPVDRSEEDAKVNNLQWYNK